ncbi:MAG: DUF397 domain-containing protein [Pseudonocardiaceae bacterium]
MWRCSPAHQQLQRTRTRLRRGRLGTSSYSGSGSACVEVAPAPDGVSVRDSKDAAGPALAVTTTAWHAFLTTLTR